MTAEPLHQKFFPWICLFTIMCMMPWLLVFLEQAVNFNLVWLTNCAERFMEGQKASVACFDTNPPLSVIMQFPPALAVIYGGLDLRIALMVWSFFLVTGSLFLVFKVLRDQHKMSWDKITVIVSSFIIANTVLTGQYIGEREQYVLLGLFPLVLIQWGMTHKYAVSKSLKYIGLIFGSIAVLIKPHYGLLPALLILHRMVSQKRFSVLRDADFVILSILTTIYITVVAIFFPDFVTVIMPESLKFYVLENYSPVWPTVMITAYVAVLIAGSCFFISKELRGLVLFFVVCGLLCMVPYVVQYKGWGYHVLPAQGFLLAGFALCFLGLGDYLAGKYWRGFDLRWLPVLCCVFLIGLSYYMFPPNKSAPTHEEYKRHILTKVITTGEEDCSFFMFDSMRVVQSFAYYTKCEYASRFPVMWFLPPFLSAEHRLEAGQTVEMSNEELQANKQKYADYIREDFERYRPDTIVSARLIMIPEMEEAFDFIDYFAKTDPAFTKIRDDYELVDKLKLTRPDFFRGTRFEMNDNNIEYWVYKRIE